MQTLNHALIAAALFLTYLWPHPVGAADEAKHFPARPIRLIVPQNPGASNDTISRIVAAQMGKEFGQQIVIDNRVGAGGTIAGEIAAHATADGHTLYATATASQSIGPQIIRNLRYDPVKDFAPISLIAITHNVLVVNPKLPVRSVKELIAYAKASPARLNWANAGAGTQSHLAGVLLAGALGIDVTHVPYKGGGASVGAVIAGESHVSITPAPAVMGHVSGGRLRALASGGAKRSAVTGDLPTLIESGIHGFVSTGWIGLLAPRDTPKPVLAKVHATLVRSVNDAATSRLIDKAGGVPETNSPSEFAAFMDEEWKRFGTAIRAAKLKAE